MTSGRATAIVIVVLTALFGVALWYFQTQAYYVEVTADDPAGQIAVALQDGTAPMLDMTGFTGIDADTSPLRFRGCFTVADPAALAATALPYPDPTPLNAPAWFDCYDATTIGEALETGAAQAYTGQIDYVDGVDRVIAVFPEGRGYAWHQLNDSFAE